MSDLKLDYGNRYLMKGNKVVGKASKEDQKNLTDWHKKKFPKKYK